MVYVKEWLQAKGWKQARLAEKMGWSDAGVSLLLSGKRMWTDDKLAMAADALGLKVVDLFRHPDDVSIDAIVSDLPVDVKQEIAAYAQFRHKEFIRKMKKDIDD